MSTLVLLDDYLHISIGSFQTMSIEIIKYEGAMTKQDLNSSEGGYP